MEKKVTHRHAGFSLMELMIALVIVAILASIAVPNYLEYVRRGNRTEAKAALLEAAARMQQHYTINNSYAAGFNNSNPAVPAPVFRQPAHYAISISRNPTATTFKLQAVPSYTDRCGTFTIDQSGERGLRLGTHTSTVDECWAP